MAYKTSIDKTETPKLLSLLKSKEKKLKKEHVANYEKVLMCIDLFINGQVTELCGRGRGCHQLPPAPAPSPALLLLVITSR